MLKKAFHIFYNIKKHKKFLNFDSILNKIKKTENRALLKEVVYGVIRYDEKLNAAFEIVNFKNYNLFVECLFKIGFYCLLYLDKVPIYSIAVYLKEFYNNSFVDYALNKLLQEKDLYFSLQKDILPFDDQLLEYYIKNKDFLNKIAGFKANLILKKSQLVFRFVNFDIKTICNVFGDCFNKGLLKYSFVLKQGVNVKKIFSNEFFLKYGYVQSYSSQLVGFIAYYIKPKLVLDLTAAPGGKCTHVAQLLNTGFVYCYEQDINRRKILMYNLKRLNLLTKNCAFIYNLNEFRKNFKNKFDLLLIDPSCSGLGDLIKHPYLKYRFKMKTLSKYKSMQIDLILNNLYFLKDGGYLLYSVCTVTKQETIEVVNEIIKIAGLKLIYDIFPAKINNYLYSPFYIALLKKIT